MPDPEQETPPPTEPALEQPTTEPEAAPPVVDAEQPESSTPSETDEDDAMALGKDGYPEGPAVFSTASMRPEAPAAEPAPSAPAETAETSSAVATGLIDRLFTHIDPIPGVVGSTEFRAVSAGAELLGKQQPHYLSQTFVSERPWRVTAIELVGDGPPPLCIALGTNLRYETQVEASAWEGQSRVAVDFRVPARSDLVLALALENPSAKPNIVIHWAVD